MKSSQKYVIDAVISALEEGRSVWLGTVVRTWGSSPRPVGSLMAIIPGSGVFGSLSGGCIEEDLLNRITDGEFDTEYKQPLQLVFGDTKAEQERLRLPCGGSLEVLLERLSPDMATLKHFQELSSAIDQRRAITRQVSLNNQSIELTNTGKSDSLKIDHSYLKQTFQPQWQMLLTGTGEVTRCVSELASAAEFSVTICDYRPAFLEGCHFEQADLVTAFPDDLIAERFHDSRSAVIALAHDPRVDDMALMEALKTEAFYVGAMGSRKTSDSRRIRLQELELTPSQIDRLHAPAGLPTGSKTPWEIAISIMAEVTRERSIRRSVQNSQPVTLMASHG